MAEQPLTLPINVSRANHAFMTHKTNAKLGPKRRSSNEGVNKYLSRELEDLWHVICQSIVEFCQTIKGLTFLLGNFSHQLQLGLIKTDLFDK